MLTCKETCAVIIVLHKKGFTGKDIAASKIAPKKKSYGLNPANGTDMTTASESAGRQIQNNRNLN